MKQLRGDALPIKFVIVVVDLDVWSKECVIADTDGLGNGYAAPVIHEDTIFQHQSRTIIDPHNNPGLK